MAEATVIVHWPTPEEAPIVCAPTRDGASEAAARYIESWEIDQIEPATYKEGLPKGPHI